MRSDGKGIFGCDIINLHYKELKLIPKFKYDFRAELDNGKIIKLKRGLGKLIFNILMEVAHDQN